ncbi:MAG: hypothetical protein ABIH26_00195 [Candidatus Eisenbacteria bacterium]
MKPLRLVVLGTLANDAYAGMAWMTMQIAAGLRRLGHDVCYFETTSTWPYDPVRRQRVCDSDYAVPYLARVAHGFGLGDRWAYRRSYLDKEWFGLGRREAEDRLARADAVFNIAGATLLEEEGLKAGRLVYFGTDPVYHEITYANGDEHTRTIIDEHDDVVTYGENIGTSVCPIPPLPRMRARTRQPVLLDLWEDGEVTIDRFTTVGNWKQDGRDVEFGSEIYYWSKHREFERFIDVPKRIGRPIEFATNLADPRTRVLEEEEADAVPAWGLGPKERDLLESNGWMLVNACAFTTDPWPYRDYVRGSRGEFTIARDLNVRLRSGWFSERSACYLAAGRPVITQDTGFGTVLPVGEGLFSFNTIDEVLAAFEAVNSDYARHGRAARAIAEEYFRAETVLAGLLADLGF